MVKPLTSSAESSSSGYFDDDPDFVAALQTIELPDPPGKETEQEHNKDHAVDENKRDEGENPTTSEPEPSPGLAPGSEPESQRPPPASQYVHPYRELLLKRKRVQSDRENGEKKKWTFGHEAVNALKNAGKVVDPPAKAEANARKEVSMSAYTDDKDVYGAANFGAFGEYMRRKRAKLQIQNTEIGAVDSIGIVLGQIGQKSNIFRGVAVYVNGWTDPSIQELRKLIIEHGGVFQPYLDKKTIVTHIITTSLTPAKIKEFQNMKVVTPAWLVDSVGACRLLPWTDFIFRPGYRLEQAQGKKGGQTSLANFATQKRDLSQVNQGEDGQRDGDGSPRKKMRVEGPTGNLDVAKGAAGSAASPDAKSNQPVPRKTTTTTMKTSPHKSTAADPDPTTAQAAPSVPGYAEHTSNPHAARAMAKPEWRAAHTSAAGANFIKGFYENSRLHHLSAWKAELKGLVKEAQERAERAAAAEAEAEAEAEADEDSTADNAVMMGLSAMSTSQEEAEALDAVVRGANDGVSMRGAELGIRSPSKASKGKGKAKAVETPLIASSSSGKKENTKVIMHCDFDSFFVSAGLVDRPELRGKPVVVCHSQGGQGGTSSTSEIASASYEARAFGVKGGMSLQQARKLCSGILTIPYEFEKYKQFSLKFYTILMGFADELQAVSVDEALIDVTSRVARARAKAKARDDSISQTGAEEPLDYAKQVAEEIRDKVRKVTNCEVSIGIAHNIMMARLATRRAKPAKSFHLLPSELTAFLAPLSLSDLPGFGRATKEKAEEKLGTSNLGELTGKSRSALCDALGKGTGETLYKALRGIDEKKLESDKERKSVSADINYGIRFETEDEAEKFVFQLAEEVARRLDAIERQGRSLTLKIMTRRKDAPVEAAKFMGHGLCDTFNKQTTLFAPGGRATSEPLVIGETAWRLLQSFSFDPKELRGVGIQIQKLESKATGSKPNEGSDTAAQPRLPFKRIDHSTKASSSRVTVEDIAPPPPPRPAARAPPSIVVDLTLSPEEQPQPSAVTRASILDEDVRNRSISPAVDLPNYSQLDPSVLDALPADVRKDLEADYKRRSVSPTKQMMPPPPNIPIKHKGTGFIGQASPFGHRNAFSKLGIPVKRRLFAKGNKPVDLSRITRQLAPKTAPSWFNPQKRKKRHHRLFRDIESSKTHKQAPLSVSDTELMRLGIDPEVFKGLPPEFQREQLTGARLAEERHFGRLKTRWLQPQDRDQSEETELRHRVGIAELLMRPTERTVIKRPKTIGVPIPKQPPPYARHPPQPTLKQPDPTGVMDPYTGKPKKVYYTRAEDVQDAVSRWVANFDDIGPAPGDVGFFAKWIVECLDGDKSTEGGLEKATRVVRWWKVLLGRKWEAWEFEDEQDEAERDLGEGEDEIDEQGNPSFAAVGKRWWKAFRQVKEKVDVIMRKRFGGPLLLIPEIVPPTTAIPDRQQDSPRALFDFGLVEPILSVGSENDSLTPRPSGDRRRQDTRRSESRDDLCVVCQQNPKAVENGRRYETCGVVCEEVLRSTVFPSPVNPIFDGYSHRGPNTSSDANPDQKPLPKGGYRDGEKIPVDDIAPPSKSSGSLTKKSNLNRISVNDMLCLMCRTDPRNIDFPGPFCGEQCFRKARHKAPLLLEAPEGHATFADLATRLRDDWYSKGTKPRVRRVYKIVLPRIHHSQYNTLLKSDRKEYQLWFGASRACEIGNDGSTDLCGRPACQLCSILKLSFNDRQFPSGISMFQHTSQAGKRVVNLANGEPLKLLVFTNVASPGVVPVLDHSQQPTSRNTKDGIVVLESSRSSGLGSELVAFDGNALLPSYLVLYEIVAG